MKAEVLAEWRTRLADRTLITLPAGAVERLLDERARLLKTLSQLLSGHTAVDAHCELCPAIIEEALAVANEP